VGRPAGLDALVGGGDSRYDLATATAGPTGPSGGEEGAEVTDHDRERDRDAEWVAATLFGTFYPKGYVIAVVEDDGAAEGAAAAVRAAGFPGEEVRLFAGDEVLAIHERYLKERSVLQRIGGAFPSEEAAALGEYLDAARGGRRFLTVHAPESAEADRVATALADQPIAMIRHYGQRTIRDLP
jgi:hypothetical protein